MTAHLPGTQQHIPLKSSFLELRACGTRRVKTSLPPHHAVRRRKISMLDGFVTVKPITPSQSQPSGSSYSTCSPSTSSTTSSPPTKHSHSLLLSSIRKGYVRRGSVSPREETEPTVSLVNAERCHAPLKVADDSDEDSFVDDASAQRRRRHQQQEHRRAVNFNPQVLVVKIPSRKAYSPQVCAAMWNSRKQIRRSAKKNAIEYAFDQYNWRSATEEEGFFCTETGLVHPAHIAA